MLHDVLFKVDVRLFLRMNDVLLLDDVNEVSDVNVEGVLNPVTVLDDQGDVEVNLCDLL